MSVVKAVFWQTESSYTWPRRYEKSCRKKKLVEFFDQSNFFSQGGVTRESPLMAKINLRDYDRMAQVDTFYVPIDTFHMDQNR